MKPPPIARWLLRALTPARDRQVVADDVDEGFAARGSRPLRARLWYWRQTAGALDVFVRRQAGRGALRPARGSFWRGVLLDARHGVRTLAATPGFTIVAVLSLAIAIGASTSLYGAMRVALMDTLPVERSEELRILHWTGPPDLRVSQYNSSSYAPPGTKRSFRPNVSFPTFAALRDADPLHVVGFNFLTEITIAVPGRTPFASRGLLVSGNAFAALRIPVALGRGLAIDDDRAGSPPVAVLTHAFWTRALGGDPAIVGSVLRINGHPFEVVGIAAPAFRGLSTGGRITPVPDAIVPVATQPLLWVADGGPSFSATHVLWVRVMIRVPGDSNEAARAGELETRLARSLVETGVLPEDKTSEVEVLLRPGSRGIDPVSGLAERPMRILAAVVAAILLVACLNIAALMLARGIGRQRELAVRQALGAGRARLVRQLLLESGIIAAAGCAAGVMLAFWTRQFAVRLLSIGLGAHPSPLPIDGRTLGVTIAVTTGAALLFGLLPAFFTTSGGLVERLRQHMVGASAPKLTLGRVLLTVQIAASIPLLVGAGLLLRTLHNLDRTTLGFEPRGLVVFRVDPAQALAQPGGVTAQKPEAAAVAALLERMLDRLAAVPGVVDATVVENPLLSGVSSSNRARIEGVERMIYMNGVGPRFFETVGIRLLAGRGPTLDDRASGVAVGVVNETAAREYFGGQALGKRFMLGSREVEVVGIAADSRYYNVRDRVPATVYDSYLQRSAGRTMHVVLRSSGRVSDLEPAVRRALAEVAPAAAVADFRTQSEHIAERSGRERLLAWLLSIFGAFALILASIGLYGATAYAVARRTSEIGIRVALGARRRQVLWMVLRSALIVTSLGLIAGLAISWWSASVLQSFLYELEPKDPVTLAFVSATMLLVSVAAALMPSLRAARMEPLTALRRE